MSHPKNRRLPLAAVNRILAETVLNIHRLHRLDLRNLCLPGRIGPQVHAVSLWYFVRLLF